VAERQNNLLALFGEAGLASLTGARPKIRAEDIADARLTDEVYRVYASLGGCLQAVPLNPGAWDMIVDDVPVELDEERHFNRYRGVTLQSSVYREWKGFDLPLYQRFCAEREQDCLRAAGFGGYWTNPSCERMFGAASDPKVLDEPGPSRWKQRAFYDFLKDVQGLIEKRPVVRFSVWEEIGNVGLGRLLEANVAGTWGRQVVSQFHRRSTRR